MSKMDDLERRFRELHALSIKDYDAALDRHREEHERKVEEQKEGRADQIEKLSRVLKVPASELERPEAWMNKTVKANMSKARAALIERPSRQAQDAKRLSQHPAFANPKMRAVPIYATNLMSSTREELAHVEGERGNPWVLPWNPAPIKIKQQVQDNQYGLCGLAQAGIFPIVSDVWFAFLADTTANWNFLALANVHGFFMLNATNSFLLCRDARVTMDVSTQVYQYFWFPEQSQRVVDEDSDTGFRFGDIDQNGQYFTQAQIRADSEWYVFLRLRFTIHATAYHGTAEINFQDGAGNFIEPLVLFAWPE